VTTPFHIERLDRIHAVEQFTCGQAELDRFLVRHAFQSQQANSSRTYVALSDAAAVGFYTIVAGEVQHANAPERVVKGMPRHPTSTPRTIGPSHSIGISVSRRPRPMPVICS
jgi:hypothetical protein